jgi:hypothetical protein
MVSKHSLLGLLLCVVGLSLLTTACFNEPTCLSTNTNLVRIAFRKVANGQTDTLALKGIVVTGIDSTYFENSLVSRVTLPLHPEETSVLFFFDEEDGQTKSLILEYRVITRVLSPSCGLEKEYLGLKISSTTFDSVRVVNRNLDRNIATNIEIFR